jgi:hypothetical protein
MCPHGRRPSTGLGSPAALDPLVSFEESGQPWAIVGHGKRRTRPERRHTDAKGEGGIVGSPIMRASGHGRQPHHQPLALRDAYRRWSGIDIRTLHNSLDGRYYKTLPSRLTSIDLAVVEELDGSLVTSAEADRSLGGGPGLGVTEVAVGGGAAAVYPLPHAAGCGLLLGYRP